jgi:hypothetical protein
MPSWPLKCGRPSNLRRCPRRSDLGLGCLRRCRSCLRTSAAATSKIHVAEADRARYEQLLNSHAISRSEDDTLTRGSIY